MDIQILLTLQQFRIATGGFLNEFFVFISSIAVDYYIAIPAMIIFWIVDKKKGTKILLTWSMSLCIGSLIKSIFCVYRPWIRSNKIHPVKDALTGASGYSFPSGHSSSSSGFYSGLFITFQKYKGICIFSVIMIFLTMFSRIYLGVHTPQDVIVGGLIGVIAALIINKIVSIVDKNPNLDWIILLVSTLGVFALLLYIFFKGYPMDYVDGKLLVDPSKMTVDGFKDPGRFYGIVLGWFLERRLVKFNTPKTIHQKIVMCLMGVFLYVFFWTAICNPLGKFIGFGPFHFLLQMICQVIFMTLYPWLSTKIMKS